MNAIAKDLAAMLKAARKRAGYHLVGVISGYCHNESCNGTRAWFDNSHDNMMEVWRFPRVSGDDRHGHATPKPVAMIVRAIRSSCPPGGVVLEPFGGSGTTLIAAADCGRVCRMMEITPKYCDVIRRRWTAYAKAAGIPAGSGALE